MQRVSAAQPPSQATAPSTLPFQAHGRTAIRRRNPTSCNLCRRRKIKCDRADPCSHCVRSKAECVSSAPSRAPRGRQGGRRKLDGELLGRIAKLENLVRHFEAGNTGATPPVPAALDRNQPASEEPDIRVSNVQPAESRAPKEGLDRYLGSSLWMNLSDEIDGMRDVLNQSSDDDDDESEMTPNSSSPGHALSCRSDFVLYAPDMSPNIGSALKHPTRAQTLSLYSSFMTNVEPAVKMLHGPSLRRFFIDETAQLDCSPGPRGWDALKFAIYYSTTTSLTPNECLEKLGDEKAILLPRFRSSTELALARADFVNTEEMSTLQALVLYLFAVRSNDNSRRTWTLTSVAVRIAHALGLHREKCGNPYTSQHRPFDREMRRRLWWQVTLLDRHATADRGSDPIITTGSFSTQLPLHVNDEDLIPGGWREVHPRDEYTDVTLALVCHEVFDVERRLNYVPASEFDASQERTDDLWAQRRNWVIESQRRIEEKYLRHCNVTIPTQRGTTLIADIIIATLWLFIYRPLQRRPDSPSSIKISPAGILHLSVEVVEKALEISMDSAIGPFRWISTIWVQWHALAVMTAELCVQTEGPMVERAWTVVGAGFEETARHIADSDKGRLWRPIKKLMTKAQAVRKQYLEDTAAISSSLCTAGALKPAEQTVPYLDAQFSGFKMMQTELEPRLMCDSSEVLRQPQQGGTGIGPLSIDWDQRLAVDPSDEMDYNNNALNQMAWTNWETFIDDFQANGDFLPGQEAAFSPSFTMW